MARLRPNRVKAKLMRGEPATVVAGTMTSDLIEFFGNLGFDGAWVEAEHGPFDFGDISDLTRACDLWGMTSIVRVNLNLPGVIYRTLDQGAQGIVMPHVDTAEQARAVVRASKFQPVGARGMITSRQGIGVENFMETANDETLVIVLIEDIVAVENLDEILKVDHIDVFFVAGSDLAQSMGYPSGHADVNVAIDQTNRRIVAAGRRAGAVVEDDTLDMYLEQGATFLMSAWEPWASSGAEAYLKRVPAASK